MRRIRINDIDTVYKVSEKGDVINNDTGKIRKPQKLNGRYWGVRLSLGGGDYKDCYIHRLVANAYLDKPEGDVEVNHIDNNFHNNHYSNLEWITHLENVAHFYDNLTYEDKRLRFLKKTKLDLRNLVEVPVYKHNYKGDIIDKYRDIIDCFHKNKHKDTLKYIYNSIKSNKEVISAYKKSNKDYRIVKRGVGTIYQTNSHPDCISKLKKYGISHLNYDIPQLVFKDYYKLGSI